MKNRRVTRGLAVPSTFFAVVGALVLLLSSCSGGPTDEAAADLAERCGTKVFDGYDHGVDLLGGGESPEARGILLHFIDRNLPRD